jgi:alpha-L-rhamnosidase
MKFNSAKPIWPKGRNAEKNLFVGFRVVFDRYDSSVLVLRVTGSSTYKIWLNGIFIGTGPARGPHGYFRVDEILLDHRFLVEKNVLAIEVAGYNVNSFYLLDQTSFIQAEVLSGDIVIASTAGKGVKFSAHICNEHVKKVQRYSPQRTFTECYNLTPDYKAWLSAPFLEMKDVSCEVLECVKLLPRRVAFSHYLCRQPIAHVSTGVIKGQGRTEIDWKNPLVDRIGPDFKGYARDELEMIPASDLYKMESFPVSDLSELYVPDKSFQLNSGQWRILDFGTNLTGFIAMHVNCETPTRLFITFDEIITNKDVDFTRLSCVNLITCELIPGSYNFESFEPYTLKYMKMIVMHGQCDISSVYIREYANDEAIVSEFSCSDVRLNRIYDAAKETFRQNALDIFMDCPSRERAGWLCDSFFTARVAKYLCGNTSIEKNFFENYLLPDAFDHLPRGMLPMCYPADHYNGMFIPNWALWFVLELEEYLTRSGDYDMIKSLEPRVMSLFEYFEKFQNSDGLLEKLENWVFVEWSKAADFVQDVNYPTNMLYAGALAAGGRMYKNDMLTQKAGTVRKVILKQAFDGQFFVDNAIRTTDGLKITRNRTEVCQYYAFFFEIANPKTHCDLWSVLCQAFGPDRNKSGAYPDIHPANAFIGNYLRLELLSRYGLQNKIKQEVADYFLYMADMTGTLWENVGAYASCNHGFASHIAYLIYRDILGIKKIDTHNRLIQIGFNQIDLDYGQGTVPVPDGLFKLLWWKQADNLHFKIEMPKGYTLSIQNDAGLNLIRS